MNIYRSKGEPVKYKTTINLLGDLEKNNWEFMGDLPSRVSVLRNATKVNLTKEEMDEHLYLTENLLENIIEDIKKIKSKL